MNRRERKLVVNALLKAAKALTADFAAVPHFKNKWKRLTVSDLRKDKLLQEELFELVSLAYKPIGGHFKIRRPSDLMNGEVVFFDVLDLDDVPDADAVTLVDKKPAGEKHVGMGHDGSKVAKKAIIKHKADDLKKRGTFAEVSDAVAHILMTKHDVPTVNDEATARKVLKGKEIEWVGQHPSGKYPNNTGWYYRDIAGHSRMKILVGRPKV